MYTCICPTLYCLGAISNSRAKWSPIKLSEGPAVATASAQSVSSCTAGTTNGKKKAATSQNVCIFTKETTSCTRKVDIIDHNKLPI